MDGVIIDSNPLHTLSWHEYLERHGLSIDDLDRRMLGKRNDEIVRDFFGRDLSPDAVFQHGAAKEALYREKMAPLIAERLVPGVVEFLRAHEGAPCAVASNAEPANLEFVLQTPALRGRFQACVNGHEVHNPKPHPDIYLEAARRLGVDSRDCIVFEDSPAGIQAGRAAGARVVGVATNGHPFDQVDLEIRDFLDPRLEPWLRALRPRS